MSLRGRIRTSVQQLSWFGDHEPEHHNERYERRNAQPEPRPCVNPIDVREWCAVQVANASEVSHSYLQPYNRKPTQARDAVQPDRVSHPSVGQGEAHQAREGDARYRLDHDGGGGEKPVSQHHLFGDHANCRHTAGAIHNPFKERRPEPSPEQDRRADDVDALEEHVRRHSTTSRTSRPLSESRYSARVSSPMQGIAPVGNLVPWASFVTSAMEAPQGMNGP